MSYVTTPVQAPASAASRRADKSCSDARCSTSNGYAGSTGARDQPRSRTYPRHQQLRPRHSHPRRESQGVGSDSFNADWEACGARRRSAQSRQPASSRAVSSWWWRPETPVGCRGRSSAHERQSPDRARRFKHQRSRQRRARDHRGVVASSKAPHTLAGDRAVVVERSHQRRAAQARSRRARRTRAFLRVTVQGRARRRHAADPVHRKQRYQHGRTAHLRRSGGVSFRAARVHRRPDDVKTLMTSSATDLKRDRSFQGAGLLDLFRMLVDS